MNILRSRYLLCHSCNKPKNNAIFSPIQEDTVVHEFATLCLASLSVDCVCKVQIFDSKGLPPLIQLLSSPDPDVQKNSIDVIFNLVQVIQSYQPRGCYKDISQWFQHSCCLSVVLYI